MSYRAEPLDLVLRDQLLTHLRPLPPLCQFCGQALDPRSEELICPGCIISKFPPEEEV